MPEGQYLGTRVPVIYTSDDGTTQWIITIDATIQAIVELGLTLATTANAAGLTNPPQGFKPRYVNWTGDLSGRQVSKRLICGTTGAAAYATNSATAITIDGAAGNVCSRRGEELDFRILPAPSP